MRIGNTQPEWRLGLGLLPRRRRLIHRDPVFAEIEAGCGRSRMIEGEVRNGSRQRGATGFVIHGLREIRIWKFRTALNRSLGVVTQSSRRKAGRGARKHQLIAYAIAD